MGGTNEAEGELGTRAVTSVSDMHRLEILQRIFGFIKGVKRQGGIVLRLLHFVVETRVFFLQVAGVGKDDSA